MTVDFHRLWSFSIIWIERQLFSLLILVYLSPRWSRSTCRNNWVHIGIFILRTKLLIACLYSTDDDVEYKKVDHNRHFIFSEAQHLQSMDIFFSLFFFIVKRWFIFICVAPFFYLLNLWKFVGAPTLYNCYSQWTTFTKIYSTGVARVLTVVSGAFYYRIDVCNLCKLLFQTQFLSNYPTIIIFYLYNNIPQVNNKCIISCNHLLTCY